MHGSNRKSKNRRRSFWESWGSHKQIILQRGLPFDVKLPQHPLDIGSMSGEQLDAELEKGYADMQTGRVVSAKKAFADIRGSYKA